MKDINIYLNIIMIEMAEQENIENKHAEGMLQVEKDALIDEELQFISVEKTKIAREGQEAELYIFYAKRTSDLQVVSFYGSPVIDSQYDLGYLKPDMYFVLDRIVSRKTGNPYYKAIILQKREAGK